MYSLLLVSTNSISTATKSILAGIISKFGLLVLIIDSNSILVNLKLKKEINELNERKLLLEKQIEIDKKIISNLKNPDSLEKYAREELYMKKDNEDIYIIEFKE